MGKNSRMMVGIDLGGTSMMLVVMDSNGNIVIDKKRSTRPELGKDGVTARIAQTLERLLQDLGSDAKRVEGVCIGAPGAIDPKKGIVYRAPNLGWTKYPLARRLRKLCELPVIVDNDVNAGAVGEYFLGAGRGTRNLVALFVGTGIGGGIIINGKLYYGSAGGAGEVGHMKILANGPVCGCGRRGCAEALASRTAMERILNEAVQSGRESAVPGIMKDLGRDRMTSRIISEALKKEDSLMKEVLSGAQEHLGLLVASIANFLDPECIVVGGGIVGRLGEVFLAPIRETAVKHFLYPENAERIRIVASVLKDHAGAAGAAVLAWNRLAKGKLDIQLD